MMKIFLANTYFQLIVATQLKLTIYKNDEAILIFSDYSNNAEKTVSRLKDANLFCDVICAKFKNMSKWEEAWHLYTSLMQKKHSKWIMENTPLCDEFIFFNTDRAATTLYLRLTKKNPSVHCHRMEEGILSYHDRRAENPYANMKLISKIEYRLRQLLKIPICQESVENFYCFYPEFYNGNLKAVQIPKIQLNSEIGELLCEIFDIKKEALVYDEKYIFFASVGDFEGGKKIGEVKTALALAEKVGKENVLVKVHPRDTTDNFAAAGLKVDTRSSVPWEAIQLNYDFADHVFLTSSSGSVLSVNMLLEPKNRPETYFLYPMMDTDGNTCMTTAIETAERLFNSPAAENVLKRIHRATSLDEVI